MTNRIFTSCILLFAFFVLPVQAVGFADWQNATEQVERIEKQQKQEKMIKRVHQLKKQSNLNQEEIINRAEGKRGAEKLQKRLQKPAGSPVAKDTLEATAEASK